jgi:hypothetical protein
MVHANMTKEGITNFFMNFVDWTDIRNCLIRLVESQQYTANFSRRKNISEQIRIGDCKPSH